MTAGQRRGLRIKSFYGFFVELVKIEMLNSVLISICLPQMSSTTVLVGGRCCSVAQPCFKKTDPKAHLHLGGSLPG